MTTFPPGVAALWVLRSFAVAGITVCPVPIRPDVSPERSSDFMCPRFTARMNRS
jgi:hypothetical protein